MKYFSFLSLLLISCSSEIEMDNLDASERLCLGWSKEAESYLFGLPVHFDTVDLVEDVLILEMGKAKDNVEKYSKIFFDCQFSMLNKHVKPNEDYAELINETVRRVDSTLTILRVYKRRLEKSHTYPNLEDFVYRFKEMLKSVK